MARFRLLVGTHVDKDPGGSVNATCAVEKGSKRVSLPPDVSADGLAGGFVVSPAFPRQTRVLSVDGADLELSAPAVQSMAQAPLSLVRLKRYEHGSIIESDDDLCFIYNTPGKLAKFELLTHDPLPLPDNYWDEEKETWEQFEARMRAKVQARRESKPAQTDAPKADAKHQQPVASGKR